MFTNMDDANRAMQSTLVKNGNKTFKFLELPLLQAQKYKFPVMERKSREHNHHHQTKIIPDVEKIVCKKSRPVSAKKDKRKSAKTHHQHKTNADHETKKVKPPKEVVDKIDEEAKTNSILSTFEVSKGPTAATTTTTTATTDKCCSSIGQQEKATTVQSSVIELPSVSNVSADDTPKALPEEKIATPAPSIPPEVILEKPLSVALAEYSRKETYFLIQQQVQTAIKNHKVFLIRGEIPYLEESMKRRGWIQKYESTKTRHLPYGSTPALDSISAGNIHLPDGSLNEKLVIFHLLRHVSPNFIWDCRNDFIEWTGNIKQDALLNRFQKSILYTSKLGMATILENAHWYHEDKVASVQCPRSYNVCRDSEAFVEDYRRTAAVSLLKWFVDQMQQGNDVVNCASELRVSSRQIKFAIKCCEVMIAEADEEYIDEDTPKATNQEWDEFVNDYIKVVHQSYGISEGVKGQPITALFTEAGEILKKVKQVDPQYELNGTRNIWILKPSDLCCGNGIIMTHKLSYIMKKVRECSKDYFVVQKYIEKPLLIQGTKFDVRQWFLVTRSYPLIIWIFKECLFRFSSRPFTFNTYHEVVHICNTAVQCKYSEIRNSVRSQEWSSEKMNNYLKENGFPGDPWYDVVCPKMCEAVVATMLAAQEHMDKRQCSFELYGADFMIMEDLSVWLIEINTNPRMHPPSTKVTERLYPQVLESLTKVVLDYPENPKVDTGGFVLAYKQDVTPFQPYLGACMFVLGKSINAQ